MRIRLILLSFLTSLVAHIFAQAPPAQLRLNAGEQFGVIRVVVRQNFISPSTLTVEEGLYRIAVYDSDLLASGAAIEFEDERGVSSRQATTKSKEPKLAYYQRLIPGRYRLKIGTRAEWILQLTVSPKKQAGVL